MVVAWTAQKIDSGANIGTKHHRQFCTKVTAATRKTWSLSRRGDGCRNCLLITEHMNTINTRVIVITKKYSNADCRHDTKSANENYLFET